MRACMYSVLCDGRGVCAVSASAGESVAVVCDWEGLSKSATLVLLYLAALLDEDAVYLAKALRALRPKDLFFQERDQRLLERLQVK